MWLLLNGRHEPGHSVLFWGLFAAAIVLMLILPNYISPYALLNLNSFLSTALLAAGLSLIWGFGGILSLGQSAFFGLGCYAYGVAAINLQGVPGMSGMALVIGLIFPILVAAILGRLMFYGRLRGVYVAIIMLVVTLLIETFLNQTAGPQWQIGRAHLGGNNGLGRFSGSIEDLPSLCLCFAGIEWEFAGGSHYFYYLCVGLIVITYLALRILVNSRFGVALMAVREDPDRTESLGYDVRWLQTLAFCIGALLAGMSGILYVSWGNFVTPSVFGVSANILPIIWVAVSGRKSIAASVVGSVVLQWGSQALALQGEYALVVQGLLLVLAVLILPEGLISIFDTGRSIQKLFRARWRTVG